MPRVNTRDTLPPRPVNAPWTASRCNRTLRQLASFVNRLKKWHKAFLAAQEGEDTDNGSTENPDRESAGEPQPDWLALNVDGRRQKPKRTYMVRSKKAEPSRPMRKPSAARLTAKTPKKKTIPVLPDEPDRENPAAGKNTDISSAKGIPKELDFSCVTGREIMENGASSHKWTPRTVHLAPDYERIIRTAASTISTFLVATSDPECPTEWPNSAKELNVARPERGPRSLVDMCLHKLSKDVVEQQKQCDAHNDGFDGQFDAIGSQLQDLEDYFGDPKTGWPHLRNATRGCGIHLIVSLIETGALPETVAMGLILRSYDSPLLADIGRPISMALVNMQLNSANPDAGYHDLPLSLDNEDPSSLSELVQRRMGVTWTLLALQRRHDSVATVSRFIRFAHLMWAVRLCRACNAQELPATSPADLLEAIYIGALSSGQTDTDFYRNGHSAPAGFDVLPKPASEPKEHLTLSEPAWNRLNMGFTLLLSISHGAVINEPASRIIERVSKWAQILYELDQHFVMTRYQLYLTAHIFFSNMCRLMLVGFHPAQNLLDSFDSVLCTIESCAGESWRPLSGNFVIALAALQLNSEQFRDLIHRLSGLDCGDCETLGILLAIVCADAAMEYAAERRDDNSMFAWATDIHKRSRAKLESKATTEPRTPARKQMRVQYRWDEDIEEWIAGTPTTLAKHGQKCTDATTGDALCTFAENPCTRDQTTAVRNHRNALRPIVNEGKPVQGCRMKRKSAPSDMQIYRDGDFEYKKRPKHNVSLGQVDKPRTDVPRKGNLVGEDSEDELSLLV